MSRNMRNIIFFVAVIIMACPVNAFAWGEIREATVNLNVREARDRKSEHMVTLAKGQRVKTDYLENGWIAVFNLNETTRDERRAIGYANAKYLKVIKKEAPTPQSSTPQAQQPSGEGEVKAPVATTPPPDPIEVGVDPTRTPVQIVSDRMTYDESGKVISFVGNVKAVHGKLNLWAEKLSAYLASKSGKKFSADSIDRIVAEGNVKAKRGKTEGECGKLTYYVEKQLLKMENDPLLKDGPNSLTGEEITFHIRENRSEVVGGKERRVKAIFMTPENVKVP